jgi:hypothetical protein
MGRRCFSDKVVESDAFYELPVNAQALYFHLNMFADDDGFINNAAIIADRIKGGRKALDKLVECRFLLKFGPVYVVKHWRISNTLKNDRLKPPAYADISQRIWIKANKAYTDRGDAQCRTLFEVKTGIRLDSNLESSWNPVGIHLESQQNLTKEKITEEKIREGASGGVCDRFMELWSLYPELRRGSMAEAKKAFSQVIQTHEDADAAISSLDKWKDSEMWHKENGQYVPNLCNWLGRGFWKNDPPGRMHIPKGASGVLGQAELEAIEWIMRK